MSPSLDDRLAGYLVTTQDRADAPPGVYRRLQLVARVMRFAPRGTGDASVLVWLNGGVEPQSLTVADAALVAIGRDGRCEIVVTDPHASRRHAVIRCLNGAAELTDLRSSNGTRLNGVSLIGPKFLKDGDVVEVGSTALVYFSVAGSR